ncbi:D-serine/D-alanine/glycine transporter CycA [Arthrobacter crystallopoietes BAB-32]|uniref:D-serine/D-alanine/glycine transporter CycA n=1 Tax=Arthrobacter crystallopoietes BAB-32 TaxID=1246476 RepID=N1V8Z9_9MICC|nr:D-serine/D-alanine/glycine transporter [Arthrobacter crystallopoietes]EMY34728.1 D-serine/D-alanine/glycine transporter CycA [Arthrobacter crystallopoietes BAB-32]
MKTDPVSPEQAPHLERQLSNRHIQLIAIGGAIGTGLFMGSGKTISAAGPSVIFVYMIIGFMLFFVMRAMGELLLSNLNYKSFSDFAADLLGPWAGFFTGWTYWFCWVVTGIADVIAIAGYASELAPGIPLWIPGLLTVAILLVLNLPTVKAFGETEFWFALIKIIAIVALIVTGLVMIFTGFESDAGPAGFSNLWSHGGFFPQEFMGFVAGFQIAVFAFVGIELVGTTAAEAKNPERNLPKAINSIPVRVLLFYVGALIILMAVTPWTEFEAGRSPFIGMFSLAGLGMAATVVNLVVLTSAMSSANSGIYSTSRMVYGLAQEGDAPSVFAKLSSRKVPRNALFLSCVLLLSGIVLLYSGESIGQAFGMVTTVSAVCFMFVWSIILASYLVYRKRRAHLHAASKFKMPGGVVMVWVVFAFFAFVLWALTTQPDTLTALLVTPVWFVVLGIAWALLRRRPVHMAREEAFKAQLAGEQQAATEPAPAGKR